MNKPSPPIKTSRLQKIEPTPHTPKGEAQSIGYVGRSMVTASLPHSKHKEYRFKREVNDMAIEIIGSYQVGLPYGVYPRLILSWLITEIVHTRKREIPLGNSLTDFMKSVGLHVSGGKTGSISRVKDQLRRLFSAHFSFTIYNKNEGRFENKLYTIANDFHLFWNPQQPDQIDLFSSYINVSEPFFEEILNHPIPIDREAISKLKKSSLALDIYFWLTYRMHNLKEPLHIGYKALKLQFGPGYPNTPKGDYEFKRQFKKEMNSVLNVYDEAQIDFTPEGLLLIPSPPHVKLKKRKRPLLEK